MNKSKFEEAQQYICDNMLKKIKSYKLMQLRIRLPVYEKIRERAYVEKRSMQSIISELFEKEFK